MKKNFLKSVATGVALVALTSACSWFGAKDAHKCGGKNSCKGKNKCSSKHGCKSR